MTERIIDYRPETPEVCPDCGEKVTVTGEQTGLVNILGSADRVFAATYGIKGDGAVTTIWNTWECPNGHWGPVLIA